MRLWDVYHSIQHRYPIEVEGCKGIVASARSVQDIRVQVEAILSDCRAGDKAALRKVWGIALPLSYRLALDDTAKNYRIASALKESAMLLEYSELMRAVAMEMEWLCQTAFGMGYSEMGGINQWLFLQLERIADELEGDWFVYSRQKTVSSILQKLSQYHHGEKLPKDKSPELISGMHAALAQFERQVEARLHQDPHDYKPYDFNVIKWLLPDLMAYTIQMHENEGGSRNLGSAKAKYQGVYSQLRAIKMSAYYGPSYSSSWHMNRMVCYLQDNWNSSVYYAAELFVRTDLDYFIGFGNYWRYKRINLFTRSASEQVKNRREWIRRVKDFRQFEEVQNLLFEEVSSGQLALF